MSEAARDTILAFAGLFAFCGGGLAMVFTQSRLHDAIRTRRPDIWEKWGRPSIVADASSWRAFWRSREAQSSVVNLIFTGASAIGDPVIARRVWQARIALLYVAMLLGGGAIFIIAQGHHP